MGTHGHVIVRHDELPRFSGDHGLFAIGDDGDAADTKARIRGRKHRDGLLPCADFSRISGEGAVLRIQHCDIVVGREHCDGEADRLTNAADFFISISRSHRDVSNGGDRDAFVDSGESGDVTRVVGFEADLSVVIFPSVGHFTILQRSREDDLVDHVTVVDFDVSHSIDEAGRIHGDGEFLSGTDAGVAIVHQGRSHREVSHDSFIAFVDGSESGDVAVTFSLEADGGVVVGPVIGDDAFAFSDLAAEHNSSGGSLVAEHLVLRLVHLHIEDLELTIADSDFQTSSIGSTDDEARDGQVIGADHAAALDLECEDSAFITSIISLFKVECRHFELVARLHVTSDGPAFSFSTVTEGQ